MVAVTTLTLIPVILASAAESLPQLTTATAKLKPIHHGAQMGLTKATNSGLPTWLGQDCRHRLMGQSPGNIGS